MSDAVGRTGLSQDASALVRMAAAEAEAAAGRIELVRAWVVDEVDGMVQIRLGDETTAASGDTARYRRVKGPPLLPGQVVQCVRIPGGYIVLGAIQQGVGTPEGVRVESQGTAVLTSKATRGIDFGAGFTVAAEDAVAPDTDTDEVNVGLDPAVVQRTITVQDDGVTELVNPTAINVQSPLTVAPNLTGTGIDLALAATLNDLVDVDTAIVVAGQPLVFNGTAWVPGAAPVGIAIAVDEVTRNGVTSNISSMTLNRQTNTWDGLPVTPGATYDVKIVFSWEISPGSTGGMEVQPYIGTSNGDSATTYLQTAQTVAAGMTLLGYLPGAATSVEYGCRFRSTDGTPQSLRNGSVSILAIPRQASRGDIGPAGPPNSLAIGTVTTGAAGSAAAATITGTAPAQTLNLTIPRGATGTPGSGGGTAATNLTATRDATSVSLFSDTGTDIVLAAADGTNAGVMTAAQATKLAGVATGATANSTDAQLRDRSTQTGTQTADTISDLAEAVDDRVASLIVAGSGITRTYDDTTGTLTLAATSTATLPEVPVTFVSATEPPEARTGDLWYVHPDPRPAEATPRVQLTVSSAEPTTPSTADLWFQLPA